MKRPVSSFARTIRTSWNLYEAVIKAEVVSEGVLPARGVTLVVGEVIHDELVDL